jgi:hypothetical protein
MLELEDDVANWLEAVTENVLLCLHSQDPQVSLELVVKGPDKQILEAAQVDIREAAKVIGERFKR